MWVRYRSPQRQLGYISILVEGRDTFFIMKLEIPCEFANKHKLGIILCHLQSRCDGTQELPMCCKLCYFNMKRPDSDTQNYTHISQMSRETYE